MDPATQDRHPAYTLGHSGDELERLKSQAGLIGHFTRHFFEEAGVTAGMRVLDVGCGAGDVSLLARELVGETGEVVGYDLSEDGVATARTRAAAQGFGNVGFHVGDPSRATFDRPFDAVIGRYVLMFQQDPAATLRRLARHVRPGGVVVFHETDCGDARSRPPVESYDRCWRWVIAGLGDADPSIGARFPALFAAAGLPQPTMRLEALIGGPESLAPVDLVVGLVATLRPEIERQGLAGDDKSGAATDSATLAARIREEAAQADSVLIGRSEIGAWCRV